MKTFSVIVVVVLLAACTTGAPQYNGQQAPGPGGYGTSQGPAIASLSSSGSSVPSASSGQPQPSAPVNVVDQSGGGSGSASGPTAPVSYAFQSSSSFGPGQTTQQGGSSSGSAGGPSSSSGSGISSSTASASAGGGSGGNLNSNCRSQPAGDGRTKFVCDPLPDEVRTLRSEHILWLTNTDGQSQVYDIEVPNYKIEELIKAGFKGGKGGDTKINVLLKKPEQNADAQVDAPKTSQGSTSVNLQYEPTVNQKIHFPTDKQYKPLTGPLLPPGGPGADGQSQPPPQGGKYIQ